jgi:hypothetical protein
MQLLCLLPIPLFIISVNYFEDPANLFQGGKYESGIVKCLLNGFNVTNVSNYDERLFQKFFIEEMPNCPEEIVLGSSRVMLISSEYIHRKLVNNGVSGATLEDDMAIFHLYEKRGCRIKKIILGLDPYLLNEHNDEVRWETLDKEFKEFAEILSIRTDNIVGKLNRIKYEELFSISYFNTSFGYLVHGTSKAYRSTKEVFNEKLTRLQDGSISYGVKFRDISPNKTIDLAMDSDKINYSMNNFTRLSERYKNMFSKFVSYLQVRHIEVDFFLAPYHPLVYSIYKNNPHYRTVTDSEQFFIEYAKQHKIRVFGSYNPAKFGLDNSYFYDGEHPKGNAIKFILEKGLGK